MESVSDGGTTDNQASNAPQHYEVVHSRVVHLRFELCLYG